MTRTVRFISLGCAKNLVDTESMAGLLRQSNWTIVAEGPADLVVVNTCSFVADAAAESVETLLEEVENKKCGRTRWLAAVGCLPEKYRHELAEQMPELDLVLGVAEFPFLDAKLEDLIGRGGPRASFSPMDNHYHEIGPRWLSTPPHLAYLKIAEGCSNHCAYCIIGRLRGPFRSRPFEAVMAEARSLIADGVKELNLVAQDLTRYGEDLTPVCPLPELLRSLNALAGDYWIRMLYVHPARINRELAQTMVDCRKIVPYLDLPLQHISDRVLSRMNRPQTKVGSRAVVRLLRDAVPGIALRTTFLVGHPGETEADFEELLEFVRESCFEHVGAFIWSAEQGTASAKQKGRVRRNLARRRLERLMTEQQAISRLRLSEQIDLTTEVLIEEVLHKHNAEAYSHIGRVPQQAPDVDGVTYVRARAEDACRPGQVMRVRITAAGDYDLFAELLE